MIDLTTADTRAIPPRIARKSTTSTASGYPNSTLSLRRPNAVSGLHISGKKRSYYR